MPSRQCWVAPLSYQRLYTELEQLLGTSEPPAREKVWAKLDELFLELAKHEQAAEEAGVYVPPDVGQAWKEAAAGILKAQKIAASAAL